MARGHASRNNRSRNSTPGWVWLLGGLVIGLFIAFLYYLQQRGGEPVEGLELPKFPAFSLPAPTNDTRAVRQAPAPKAPAKKTFSARKKCAQYLLSFLTKISMKRLLLPRRI